MFVYFFIKILTYFLSSDSVSISMSSVRLFENKFREFISPENPETGEEWFSDQFPEDFFLSQEEVKAFIGKIVYETSEGGNLHLPGVGVVFLSDTNYDLMLKYRAVCLWAKKKNKEIYFDTLSDERRKLDQQLRRFDRLLYDLNSMHDRNKINFILRQREREQKQKQEQEQKQEQPEQKEKQDEKQPNIELTDKEKEMWDRQIRRKERKVLRQSLKGKQMNGDSLNKEEEKMAERKRNRQKRREKRSETRKSLIKKLQKNRGSFDQIERETLEKMCTIEEILSGETGV